MHGETDPARLIRQMRPQLDPETWVFVTLPRGQAVPAGLDPLFRFREAEGLTLVLTEAEARAAGLDFAFPSRRITLTIHSSLDAVGLIAAVAAALAKAGIACNPVAGFHHDHLFVPAARAADAMAALEALGRRRR